MCRFIPLVELGADSSWRWLKYPSHSSPIISFFPFVYHTSATPPYFFSVTRVNSTNVLNEGLRIGEIGRQMNSKVKLVEIGVYRK
jgi:hypothetical protein